MNVHVRLFAAAAEACGKEQIEVSIERRAPHTIADVRDAIAAAYPMLEEILRRAWFAVNEEYATHDVTIQEKDRIAIIPPVSGGSQPQSLRDTTWPDLLITRDILSVNAMYDHVLRAAAGAVVLFSGTVREFTRGRQTDYLEYEAYEEMALEKMRAVKNACVDRWPDAHVALWHRVGRLALTETSVLIGVSTPHRKDAFAAGQFAIDTLKRTVPIWKKEFFSDGQVEWVGPDGPWNPTSDQEGDPHATS